MFEMAWKRVEVSDSVLEQQLRNEIVLLDLKAQKYYGLDEIGAQAWKLIKELDGNLIGVAETLERVYEVDQSTLHMDLAHLIEDLLEKGLLKAI